MQVRARLWFLYLTVRTSGCALFQLPQVVTKTFATQLFAKVSLLQHHLVYCVCGCVCAQTYPRVIPPICVLVREVQRKE